MKIRTICYRIDNAGDFDYEVNKAIEMGWTLKKREVIVPSAQSDNIYTHIMLYAELEMAING